MNTGEFNFRSVLDQRTKRIDHYAYKLGETNSYGMDVAFGDNLDIDEERMAVWIPFADGNRRDGVGDLLEVAGINTERHRQNPIILFDHGKQVTLPIGLAEDPHSKHYMVVIDPVLKLAKCKAFFYQSSINKDHAIFCEQLFDLMAKRYVRAGSIGYQVIHARELGPDYERGTPKGLHLLATMMLEASAVVMPANQDTVRKALALPRVCGKPLSTALVKCLTPYAPETKAIVVGGYKSVPSVTEVKQKMISAGLDVLTVTQSGGKLIVMVDRAQTKKAEQIVTSSGWVNEVKIQGGDKAMKGIKSLRQLYRKKAISQDTFKGILNRLRPGESKTIAGCRVVRSNPPRNDSRFAQDAQFSIDGGEWMSLDAAAAWLFRVSPVKSIEAQPSSDISPEKARQILKDGTVHGHPLTDKQRRMFGAAAGRGKSVRDLYKRKAAPRYSNVSDYNVGEHVAARGYLSYIGSSGKTEPFAKTGERLKVVNIESNGMITVRRADGATASFSSAEVRKTKGLEPARKDLSNIRMKYRRTKGFKRTLKKGVAGSSMVYVRNKDLEAIKKHASDRGLDFKHVGVKNGLEKIRLTGDEKAIDEAAKQFGRPLKSFGRCTKAFSWNGQMDQPVRITGGEYAGMTGKIYGQLPKHGAVGTSRGKFSDIYRVQIDGFGKPGGWDGKVTINADFLQAKALILDPSKPLKQNMTRAQVKESWLRNKGSIRAYFESQGFSPGLIERLESEMHSGKYPWEMSLETRDQERKVAALLTK